MRMVPGALEDGCMEKESEWPFLKESASPRVTWQGGGLSTPIAPPYITCQCFLLVKCHPSDTPRQETLYILIRICAFYTEFMEKAWTSRRDLAWKPCKIFKRKVSTWDNCAE